MDINLSGSEMSVIKALGLSGTEVLGTKLLENLGDFSPVELVDALQGLIAVGYVDSDKSSGCSGPAALEVTSFHVNTSYARELKDALYPHKKRDDGHHWRGGK